MKIYPLFLAFFICTKAFAAEDPRPQMHEMAREITALQKFLLSEAEFSLPKNEEAIGKSLGSLDKHLGGLSRESFKDDPALRENLTMLQGHIKDANRAFHTGAKPYARFMLQSSLQMCIACHTRHKAAEFSWPEPEADTLAPMDKADYYFATRQFTKGKAIYERVVAEFPANKNSQLELRRALLALAVFYARITENPAGGAEYFSQAAKNGKLPAYLQLECKAWAAEFSSWAKERPKGSARDSDKELLGRAKKLLRHDDFSLAGDVGRSYHVRRLRASSLLHRVLESPSGKSPFKAEALLLLGQIYPRVSSHIFFRFGEMYLKACIEDYQKTATARSCYVALESLVSEGFSGSGGTDIPEDEQVELFRLKRLAF